MKLDIRKNLELVGVVAVVASLIFVGMQLLLDRRIANAEQYANRAESRAANLRTLLESEAYFHNAESMWELGNRPSWWNENSAIAELVEQNKLSVQDLFLQIQVANLALLGMDNLYFQYQQGLLSDDFWEQQEQILKSQLRNDELRRSIFQVNSRPINEVVSQLISEIELEESLDGT